MIAYSAASDLLEPIQLALFRAGPTIQQVLQCGATATSTVTMIVTVTSHECIFFSLTFSHFSPQSLHPSTPNLNPKS